MTGWREEIGPPECPLMHRWTLVKCRFGKVLVHHFSPGADDLAVHDHPSSFITIVLRGSYDDLVRCPRCGGEEHAFPDDAPCGCDGGLVLGDRMRPGSIRFRRASHAHRTPVGPKGCWTLVLMGPKRRDWGFWRRGVWWEYRQHERRFGFGWRCPDKEGS